VLSLLLDVTEKHRHEELLRQSEERFSKAFRSSPLGIAIVTVNEGRYVDVNDAFARMLGAAYDELVGKTVWQTNLWVDSLDRHTMIANLRKIGRFTMQTRFNTKTKGICYVQIASELIDLGGEACVLSISNDISEAKKLEQQFRQAQKMEAVGRLAGGVAHDFNNMLGIILGYSELLLDRLQDTSSQDQLREMKAAAERAATLTRQLLAFSRQQVLQPKVLDLNTVIKDLSSMLRRMIGEDIDFSFNPGSNLGRVEADRGQIEQILMNLAVNARDAMPRGGKLIIDTSNAELDEVYASTHPGARPGPYVCISVSDSGVGIPPEVLPHIYEPFFTTKGQGQGTGLGLSMVYGVVKQSGGYIWAYSEVGKGTRFKVFLPRVQTPVDQEAPKPMVSSAKGSGTILLVEDDAALRKLTRGVLETHGYAVLEAKDGESALEICSASGTHIDLLLTDVVMPKMSGHELAVRLRDTHPGIRVMYISGYTNDLIATHGVLHDNVALLEKPFTRSSLLKKVEDVLNGQANS